jgi:23S rRNA (cytosine1962-C5)-methyltransferase
MSPIIHLLPSPRWLDYELLDSGNGQKLERFGSYIFARPEMQALWGRGLPADRWMDADGVFIPSGEESGGHWSFKKKIAEKWEMSYDLSPHTSRPKRKQGMRLHFTAMTTPGRHLGVFPECAAHWDWIVEKIINRGERSLQRTGAGERGDGQNKTSEERMLNLGERGKEAKEVPADLSSRSASNLPAVNVLNLFGYTGLGTLAAAAAMAKVTHVDASKKSVTWARENATLSGLAEKPIRWIVDDALKFVEREARRGVKYDGILLDPPKFGRGPKGEVWEVYKSLPELLQACRAVLSGSPLFVVLTVYAVKLPAIHVHAALEEMMIGFDGTVECGELVTQEKSAGRLLSQAVYARWGKR